jgi:hypothetical protein
VTFLGDALGLKRWLEAFASLVTLVVFTGFALQFFLFTLDLQASGRVTSTILMPVAPWWWVTAVILITTVPVQMWVVAARVVEAISGGDLVEERPLGATDDVIEGGR